MNAIIEQLSIKVPDKEQIGRLQEEVSKLPQTEPLTEHYFSNGMYCRKMTMPTGMLLVGKAHKQDHFFLITKGEVVAWTENGMKNLCAGDIIESKIGTKRVIYAITDSIVTNVHKSDKTDLDELEAELVEFDEKSLFDSSNKLNDYALELQKTLLRSN
jgi:quercetin dioxygenase-like cupin family protein